MCELDWSGSAEGLWHESCENDKRQFDFMKDIEILVSKVTVKILLCEINYETEVVPFVHTIHEDKFSDNTESHKTD